MSLKNYLKEQSYYLYKVKVQFEQKPDEVMIGEALDNNPGVVSWRKVSKASKQIEIMTKMKVEEKSKLIEFLDLTLEKFREEDVTCNIINIK